ncbi:serpin family protein [Flavitalea flava]
MPRYQTILFKLFRLRSAFTFSRFVLVAALSCPFAFSLSCKKSNGPEKDIAKDIVLPATGPAVIQAGQQFAFDFFRANQQTDNNRSSNKLISPFSIYLTLSMAFNGAANATQDSMKEALRLKNLTPDDLNNTCQALLQQLPFSDNKVEISIANSIWYRQGMQPLPGFLDITKKDYAATVQELNFSDPASVKTINDWVSTGTQQKIPKILDKINANDLLFLINAVYFKGTWQYPFDRNATKDAAFYRTGNSSVTTPFMYLHQTPLGYFRNDSLQMIQLPYGGGNFTMSILLPNSGLTATDILSGLNAASFQYWQNGSTSYTMDLYLPKFKYSYSIGDMKPALSLMGMSIAFGDHADFSGMYNSPVMITQAIHKTFIETNEEGTVAAAATVIGMGTMASMPLSIKLDHPFLYVIQEKTSGTILFTGLINDPSQ